MAQALCTKTRPENARARVTTDVHAPPRFRVDGTMANMPEFAAAFACQPGDRMVRAPADRCAVW